MPKRIWLHQREMKVSGNGSGYTVELPCSRGNGREILVGEHKELAIAMDLAVRQILELKGKSVVTRHKVIKNDSSGRKVRVAFSKSSPITVEDAYDHVEVLVLLAIVRRYNDSHKHPELRLDVSFG
jgi:hypothetical protein